MKRLFLLLLAGVFTLNAAQAQEKQQTFGEKFDEKGAVAATEVPTLLQGKDQALNLKIYGEVVSVCQAKGCWMTLKVADGQEMTVKFKDYAFFMPKDCSGKKVIFSGKAFRKVISVAEQKHLAEDAGKSKEEINKIAQPKEEYRFEASGVILVTA
jgi:hypothetical protein